MVYNSKLTLEYDINIINLRKIFFYLIYYEQYFHAIINFKFIIEEVDDPFINNFNLANI